MVRGSGNVFRDLAHKNADAEQFKAILAAEIIKALDREHLTVRAAHGRTGIAAADFSRIRNADLGRFTLDRLVSILNRLGSRVDVTVRVRRADGAAPDGVGPGNRLVGRPDTDCVHVHVDVQSRACAISIPCLLYTSPSPRDRQKSRMPSSA